MMKSQKFLILWVCLLFVLGGMSVVPAEAADYEQAQAAAEELLEHSLRGVQARMQKVSGDNTSLTLRNAALRQRLMSLQKYITTLEDQKIDLLEEFIEMRDVLKEQKDERTWIDAREKRLAVKRAQLLKEKKQLARQIQEDVHRQGGLQETLMALERAMGDLQEGVAFVNQRTKRHTY